MSKRLSSVLLVCALAFALCACGEAPADPAAQTDGNGEEQEMIEAAAAPTTDETQTAGEPDEETQETTSKPAPAPTSAPNGSSGSGSGNGGNGGSTVRDLDDYAVGEWIDMGDWFFYINSSVETPVSDPKDPFWRDNTAILQQRYPDRDLYVDEGIILEARNQSVWCERAGAPQEWADFADRLLVLAAGAEQEPDIDYEILSVYNLEDYPVCEWIDMGDWFFYVKDSSYFQVPPDFSFYAEQSAILDERYPDRPISGIQISGFPHFNKAVYCMGAEDSKEFQDFKLYLALKQLEYLQQFEIQR